MTFETIEDWLAAKPFDDSEEGQLLQAIHAIILELVSEIQARPGPAFHTMLDTSHKRQGVFDYTVTFKPLANPVGTVTIGVFTNLTHGNTLDHETRARIMDILRQTPGLSVTEIARRLVRTKGNTRYHLRVLQNRGLAESRTAGGLTGYFRRGAAPKQPFHDAARRHPGVHRVLHAILADPGLSISDLATRTGVGPGTARYHLHRLAREGLVSVQKQDVLRAWPVQT